VAELPDGLTASANRDAPFVRFLVPRWITAAMIGVLLVLALLNVFGQRPDPDRAEGDAATLEVYAPTALRGGLFFEGRFTVEAKRDIESATLVLDPGWTESIHINTIEPSPVGEASRDGKLALDFGHVPRGQKLVAYLQFQVNPTNVGRRSQDVVLADGEETLLAIDRDVTIFP
jgi:hypothetical protein